MRNKRKTFVRIVACVLAVIMLLTLCASVVYADNVSESPANMIDSNAGVPLSATEDALTHNAGTEQKPLLTSAETPRDDVEIGVGLADSMLEEWQTDTVYLVTGTGFEWTLADIASEEYSLVDSFEYPYGSDDVKYNTWFYGHKVSNPVADNEYIAKYRWDTTFVCWCADKMGLLDFGYFPRTSDGANLYNRLVQQGNTAFGKADALADMPMTVQSSDLIFVPDGRSLRTGIVTSATQSAVTFITGDLDGCVDKISTSIAELSDDARFVRLSIAPTTDLYAFAAYFCEKLDITPAAACGMLANIQAESGYVPTAIGDEGTSYGICQWHLDRWDLLITFCEMYGYDCQCLDDQLKFLIWELKRDYPETLQKLRHCDNSRTGAYQAGFYFCTEYEKPDALISSADIRGTLAERSIFPTLFFNADSA